MISVFAFAKVDINHADKSELTTLSGIGDKRAEAIIKYREANGCFKDVNDIKNISGIGNKMFDGIKDDLEITPCEAVQTVKPEVKVDGNQTGM